MKKLQHLSIHDYESGAVLISYLPEHLQDGDCEDIEEYLTETLNYKLGNIEWMIADSVTWYN